jgi:hypothetical protein
MCDSPHLRAGCTLKHGSGNLMELMSTTGTTRKLQKYCWGHLAAARSKLRLVLVEPAGGTDFLRGALEPHTLGRLLAAPPLLGCRRRRAPRASSPLGGAARCATLRKRAPAATVRNGRRATRRV